MIAMTFPSVPILVSNCKCTQPRCLGVEVATCHIGIGGYVLTDNACWVNQSAQIMPKLDLHPSPVD